MSSPNLARPRFPGAGPLFFEGDDLITITMRGRCLLCPDGPELDADELADHLVDAHQVPTGPPRALHLAVHEPYLDQAGRLFVTTCSCGEQFDGLSGPAAERRRIAHRLTELPARELRRARMEAIAYNRLSEMLPAGNWMPVNARIELARAIVGALVDDDELLHGAGGALVVLPAVSA